MTESDALRAENEQLRRSLYDVLVKLHPVYPNTAGPYDRPGMISGDAMTPWCHVLDLKTDDAAEIVDNAHRLLQEPHDQTTEEKL